MAHYCIKCGSQLETRVIEGRELEACPNDDFVLWRDPKVASAVVVEVDGGVVLGRRSIDPGYGLWCLPGGFVNDDEHPAGAAMRECMEAIGAAVESDRAGEALYLLLSEQTARHLDGETAVAIVAAGESPDALRELRRTLFLPRARSVPRNRRAPGEST